MPKCTTQHWCPNLINKATKRNIFMQQSPDNLTQPKDPEKLYPLH